MSVGPANALEETHPGSPQIAGSAVVVGVARMGEGALLAAGPCSVIVEQEQERSMAAVDVGRFSELPEMPSWALRPNELPAQTPSRR